MRCSPRPTAPNWRRRSPRSVAGRSRCSRTPHPRASPGPCAGGTDVGRSCSGRWKISAAEGFTSVAVRGNLQLPLEVHLGRRTPTTDPPHDLRRYAAMMLTSNDPFAATSAALRALDHLPPPPPPPPPRRPRPPPPGAAAPPPARARAGMPMDAYRVGDNFVAHFD